jgi:uncharacterized lipoprotein YmbA
MKKSIKASPSPMFGMSSRTARLLASCAAAALLLIGGCASKPTLYYTLASPAAGNAGAGAAAAPAPFSVELAPLAVPERLARPQMVVQQQNGGVQVEVLEQHRWASSFENELRDALASGIAARLGALDVTKGGRSTGGAPVWRIAVQLRQFDMIEGARVDAGFAWTLRRSDQTRVLACQLNLSEPVSVGGIDGMAQGAQRVGAAAAAALARSVTAAAEGGAGVCAG